MVIAMANVCGRVRGLYYFNDGAHQAKVIDAVIAIHAGLFCEKWNIAKEHSPRRGAKSVQTPVPADDVAVVATFAAEHCVVK